MYSSKISWKKYGETNTPLIVATISISSWIVDTVESSVDLLLYYIYDTIQEINVDSKAEYSLI